MPEKPMGQIKTLRMEVARLEEILALHVGALREIEKEAYEMKGGFVARIRATCARHGIGLDRQPRKSCG